MGGKRKAQKSWLSVHWPMVFLGTAAIALLSGIGYMAFLAMPPKPESGAAAVPVHYDRAEDAMPFPATLEPAQFKHPQVQEAYRAAKQIPEVLAQQPCYCYCKRRGHRSLLDCFSDKHGSDCDICVREAIFAQQEHKLGKSAEQIRTEMIDGAWKSIQVNN